MKNENTSLIETERLILRKFTKNDIHEFFQIMGDEETNEFLPWFPITTLKEAKQNLEKNYLFHYNEPNSYRYAICLKEDNKPIGYAVLNNNNSYDFGYGLRKEFWYNGIVTEASTAIVIKIKHSGFPYITATHDVNNPRSGAIMKKLGMTYRYSYVEQWQPKNIPITFRMYQLNFDISSNQTYMEYWNKYSNHYVEHDI